MKDLTVSNIDRQNILNNPIAIDVIQQHIGTTGLFFRNEFCFTTKMVAQFYEVDIRTIKRLVEKHELEVKNNGYTVLKGEKLKEFKALFGYLLAELEETEQRDIDVPLLKQDAKKQSVSKIKSLAIFNFRAFLNIGMLLVESEMAKALRSRMLDIVIDSLNQKTGGSTKYINQRDEDFLNAILKEPQYRKEFTNALNEYLDLGGFKYSYYTDKIYQAVFKEKSEEYKRILKLEAKDNVRDTMYAEVLKLIASFETGMAHEMKLLSEKEGRKITKLEMDNLLISFAIHPLYKPLIDDARTKMATRDYGFRRVLHDNLEQYIDTVSKTDFERFLGEKSKSLEDRIEENIDVFKRLKDR